MADVIKVKDPRGVIVTCDSNQWYNHVCTEPHLIMVDNANVVEKTIVDPCIVFKSSTGFSNRSVYFRENNSEATYNQRYTKLIVEHDTDDYYRATLVTAFPHDKVKGGITNEILYKKNKL